MVHNKIKLENIPFPEGRFKFTKKEFLTLLLEAIEEFRSSSCTPKGKRLMVPVNLLVKYIAFGTMKSNNVFYLRQENRKLGHIRKKINEWMGQCQAQQSGRAWIIETKNLTILRRELLETFIIKVVTYKCSFCGMTFKSKPLLRRHLKSHLKSQSLNERESANKIEWQRTEKMELF